MKLERKDGLLQASLTITYHDFSGIYGLIGLDILLQGKFLIDLDKMEITRDL